MNRPRRRRPGRVSAALAALTLAGGLIAGCSTVHSAATWSDPRHPVAGAAAQAGASASATGAASVAASASASATGTGSAAATGPAYDITSLLHPTTGKYYGVEIDNGPDSLAPVKQFATWTGAKPNIVGQYVAWGSAFDSKAAANAWSYGALDFVVWEPWNTSISQIADGASDQYISSFAGAVRQLNVPIVLSFGHEFNGNWYPWGTTGTTAADFVAAWRHTHDLFAAAGATNVIWVWDPNDIFPMPNVSLKPYYPGDAYVDWVGVTGYWTQPGPNSYASLYLPTLTEAREFTQKPFIIAETAVEAGSNQSRSVTNLFQAVEQHSDILGFVWYDYNKGGDWRVENRPTLMTQLQSELSSGGFGFG